MVIETLIMVGLVAALLIAMAYALSRSLDDAAKALLRKGGGAASADEEGCAEEWRRARENCRRELGGPNRGVTGGYRDVENCARGSVSELCGGNPVQY